MPAPIACLGPEGSFSHLVATQFSPDGGLHTLESVDEENPWLDPFYSSPEGMRIYALHLQLHFLATRFATRFSGIVLRRLPPKRLSAFRTVNLSRLRDRVAEYPPALTAALQPVVAAFDAIRVVGVVGAKPPADRAAGTCRRGR